MRAVLVILGLAVAFFAGGYVDHAFDWPYGMIGLTAASVPSTTAPAPPASTTVPRYSDTRGLEDAPRADTPQGAATDFQRCVNTMILRRESETEARTVCQKIIAGISR